MKTPVTQTRGAAHVWRLPLCLAAAALAISAGSCSTPSAEEETALVAKETLEITDKIEVEPVYVTAQIIDEPEAEKATEVKKTENEQAAPPKTGPAEASAEELRASLEIVEDLRPSLYHGPKEAANQKYIVLHDTEGDSDAASVIDWWDGNGNLVAAHFIVNRDGSVWQCVPLDRIAHHAGYGDTGHNDAYGIQEDGRDDMASSSPIGGSYADYGMNAWSVGIEMVHVGGEGDYPEAQLEAVDGLIAYIDAYFGFESEIIDHKAWRTGNSDTSPEFAGYLKSYQTNRRHE